MKLPLIQEQEPVSYGSSLCPVPDRVCILGGSWLSSQTRDICRFSHPIFTFLLTTGISPQEKTPTVLTGNGSTEKWTSPPEASAKCRIPAANKERETSPWTCQDPLPSTIYTAHWHSCLDWSQRERESQIISTSSSTRKRAAACDIQAPEPKVLVTERDYTVQHWLDHRRMPGMPQLKGSI